MQVTFVIDRDTRIRPGSCHNAHDTRSLNVIVFAIGRQTWPSHPRHQTDESACETSWAFPRRLLEGIGAGAMTKGRGRARNPLTSSARCIYLGRSLRGYWVIKQKTAASRFSRAVRSIDLWCRDSRHTSIGEQQQKLNEGERNRGRGPVSVPRLPYSDPCRITARPGPCRRGARDGGRPRNAHIREAKSDNVRRWAYTTGLRESEDR
jgi:hypothetical protein